MQKEDFKYLSPAKYTRGEVVAEVQDTLKEFKKRVPLGYGSQVFVTAYWNVLDQDWPGGNDRAWFGASIEVKPSTEARFLVLFEVTFFLHRGP